MQGKKRRLFSAITGLNTVTDPTRINFDPESGISDLGVAVNVTIDQTGWIGRREGYTSIFSGNCHSLYSNGSLCVFVSDSILYQLLPNYASTVIKAALVSNEKMAYTDINGSFYYTNGIDYGIINDAGIHEDWIAQSYIGPITNKVFDGPRAGNHLAFFAGRIFVSEATVLWWSEPYAFSWFDRTRNYIEYNSKIRMIKPVEQGIFVSDAEKTYFLSGRNPQEFNQTVVAPYPAVEWSDAINYVETWEMGLDNLDPGLCALWASLEGACLGTSIGVFLNLNKKKVIYPERGTYGTSLVKGYHFIHSIGG